MKKFLKVVVTRHDGTTFLNELKLSEVHLISKLAQVNRSLEVSIAFATPALFKSIFG